MKLLWGFQNPTSSLGNRTVGSENYWTDKEERDLSRGCREGTRWTRGRFNLMNIKRFVPYDKVRKHGSITLRNILN